MLKKLSLIASLLALMLLAGSNFIVAQDLQILNKNGNKDNAFDLVSSSKSNTSLTFQLNSYWLNEVHTPNGAEKIVNAMESARMLQAGAPDLPLFSASLIIPDQGKMEVKIANSTFTDVENVSIAPSKGNLTRDINPNDVAYEYGKVYQENTFFPGKLAQLNKPYIVRDFRGEALWVYPFQYNPVTRTLRIYTSVELEVVATTGQGENEFNRTKEISKITREFDQIYNRQFINYDNSKYDPVDENGTMLIICHDDWTAEMQPLVDWKNLIGRPTEMVTATEAGSTASAIGTYVADYYNNNGLTHLLLVGDAAQIPTNSGASLGGDSDNAYAYVTGDDHYLEFFVGRFSAETATDVTTQVERTITYEDGSTLATGWLSKTMGITSSEGTGDDNEYDYDHYLNMVPDFLGFTYTESIDMFDGTQGGNDLPGNPTPTMVSDALNTGVGIINYTGHGSDNSWVSSGYSNSDINGLTNENMLPFIWSVACVNGNFVGQTCFGEGWMRATNGDNPTGAIAIFASTINQSWAPPMAGQDEMVDILVESYENNIKRTYGGLSFNGCHLMNDEYSDFAMTDTWTIFGDPSLLVRTEDPSNMVVSFPGALPIGQESFTVTCDTEDALVCLTIDGEILATATVTNSTASLSFDAPSTPGEMNITITGFNKITYQGTIEIIPANESFIVLNQSVIDDAAGNNNGMADYGETISLNVNLKNVAESGSGYDATNLEAVLTTSDEYITITDDMESYGTINAGDSTTIDGAFTFTIADNTPDQHVAEFAIVILGDNAKETWHGSLTVTINAPSFEISNMTIANDDDANGRIDPGETADISFTVSNIGQGDAVDVLGILSGDSPYLSVSNDVTTDILANGNATYAFGVTASAGAPQGSPVNLNMSVASGGYSAEINESTIIGQAPEITIGNGTQDAGNYPFYTYYENNLTQMLYLGAEIGAGNINIQEMALNFTTIGSESSVQNLSIKFIETSSTELGTSYEDMAGATEVFSAATYTMPNSAGWHTFDISDYVFDASNNLLIEIVWGDNGAWSSPAYVVQGTTTAFTSVVFGYADSETPPSYDGNSSVRPNMMLFIEGEAPGTQYSRTFNVTDGTNPIEGATVNVGGYSLTTNASGVATMDLFEGDYYYSAEAEGYESLSNTPLTVSGVGTTEIQLVQLNQYTVTFTVTDGTNPLENATVYFAGETLTTNSSGIATFTCFEGTYSYSAEMAGYYSLEAQSVTVDQNLSMDISLDVIPVYDITFTVTDGTNPLENATVTFNSESQNTNSSGVATFTCADGVFMYSIEMDGYTPIMNQAVIVDQNMVIDITLEVIPVYTIGFTVTDGTSPLENAAVTFNGELQNTNASGIATFTCYEGSYSYSVEMAEYTPILDQTIFVNQDMDMDIALDLIPVYTIGFTVTDGTNPLENAAVTFNGELQNTNASGIATFTCYEGSYSYSVEMAEYTPILDQTIFVNQDMDMDIALDLIVYTLTFTVTDGTIPLENAAVTFNGELQNTNSDGIATFTANEGDYTYSVELEDYTSVIDQAISVSEDVTTDVTLDYVGLYAVSFTVTDGTDPIENASVTFNSVTVVTDINGEAAFEEYEGAYNYSVVATGYESITDESITINSDLEHTIVLTPVGFENSFSSEFNIYPNPTRDVVIIELGDAKSDANITILDMAGKSLIYQLLETNKTRVELNDISNGIYLIKIRNGNSTLMSKITIR